MATVSAACLPGCHAVCLLLVCADCICKRRINDDDDDDYVRCPLVPCYRNYR